MNILKKFAYRLCQFFLDQIFFSQRYPFFQYSSTASQLQLKLTYRALTESGNSLPSLSEVGFKVYSETDEDGILLYIFAIIGSVNKKCVEICAGNGIECNTANLIVNHGWRGLLIDGNKYSVEEGKMFYKKNQNTHVYPPTFVHAWVTRDNVNEVIMKNGFKGEIDLLSIDMDGVDYWIWDAVKVIGPRVVVVEYQDIIGPEKALTVPYSDDFNAYKYPSTLGMPNFSGASLPAFVKLARQKGYRLVGCNKYGYNAFFIQNSLGKKDIPEIPVIECFNHPRVIWGIKKRFPTVSDLPWEEV